MTFFVQVTHEEITAFRAQLVDYPNQEALNGISALEECNGYLADAIPLLMIRETGTEPDRSVADLLARCRQFICKGEVRDALQSGLIAPAIEPIAIGAGVPPGAATAIAICAFKFGMNTLCAGHDTKVPSP